MALDPLDSLSHRTLGDMLHWSHRYDEAGKAYQASIAADLQHASEAYGMQELSYYSAGQLASAKVSCQVDPENYRNQICLAIVYHSPGRYADAAAELAKLTKLAGDASAYQYAEINAQWGDREAALRWLDKALQLLDPLRADPRFQSVLRELHFPSEAAKRGGQSLSRPAYAGLAASARPSQ